MPADLPEPRRRDLYRALLRARAEGVRYPRYAVAKYFCVTIAVVEAVEDEALRGGWAVPDVTGGSVAWDRYLPVAEAETAKRKRHATRTTKRAKKAGPDDRR